MAGITANFSVSGQGGIIDWLRSGGGFISDEAAGWIIGTNVEYSIYVEFGTSSQPAQPYLFPAAKEVLASAGKYWAASNDMDDFVKKLAFAIEARAKTRCPVDTGRLMNSIEAEKL